MCIVGEFYDNIYYHMGVFVPSLVSDHSSPYRPEPPVYKQGSSGYQCMLIRLMGYYLESSLVIISSVYPNTCIMYV